MPGLSVLDTVWYNEQNNPHSLRRLVVIVATSWAEGDVSGTAIDNLTDDVESILDTIRRAKPLSEFDCIAAG